LLEELSLKLVIALLEIRDEPINDTLKGNISDQGLHGFSTELSLALRALIPILLLSEIVEDATLAN
jgi:hypothetical protein